MHAGVLVSLDGFEVWANVIELDDGFKLRLSLDEWDATRLSEGLKISVQLPGNADVPLFIASVSSYPPFAWVTLLRRIVSRPTSRTIRARAGRFARAVRGRAS